MKDGTLLQPAASRNSAARQSEISQSMSGDEEIPHPSLISEKKAAQMPRFCTWQIFYTKRILPQLPFEDSRDIDKSSQKG